MKDYPTRLPRIHPRERIVRDAELELSTAVLAWSKAYGDSLTFCETLKVVQSVLGAKISSLLKYAIRDERHGDTDKPGGLE